MSTRSFLYGHGVRMRGDRSGPLQQASWKENQLIFHYRPWECDECTFTGACSHHLVVLTEAGHTRKTSVRDGSRLIYNGRDYPGALSFVPAGVERRCTYSDVKMSFSALWIHPDFEENLTEHQGRFSERLTINGDDARIATLLCWLRDEALSPARPDDLFFERIAALILFRIAELDGRRAATPTRSGRLNGPRLRRTEAFIEANLTQNISLGDLAAQAEMPLDTFARHFRNSTGQSPYAFIVERRLCRAEQLMREGDRAIADIALVCGFSSQSHFTNVFRQRRGATPGVWRAQFLPES